VRYSVIKTIYRTFFLVGLAFFYNTSVIAQDPDPDPGCPPPCQDPDLPIDGGASILIAAGVAYGLKKVHDKRKQSRKEELQ